MSEPLLRIEHLSVAFPYEGRFYRAVDDVSLAVPRGAIFALVGESGCGKSTVASAIVKLVSPPGYIETGAIWFEGQNVLSMTAENVRKLRGDRIVTIVQGAMNSFNPVVPIGRQFEDVLEAHPGHFSTRKQAWDRFRELLTWVHLDAQTVPTLYPHNLSGGMKQRLAIAMSLVLEPALLILDEPTTALDVLNQRAILEIIQRVHAERGVTILFITHDLGIVAALASQVGAMYAGQLVDHGTVDQIFYDTYRHPYVRALLQAAPSILLDRRRAQPIPGNVPAITNLPTGCRFANRCALVEPRCEERTPPLIQNPDGHAVRCWVVAGAETLEKEWG